METQQIDYALPKRINLTTRALVSIAMSCVALAMEGLFWRGAFASDTAILPLSAVFVTALFSIFAIIIAVTARPRSSVIAALGTMMSMISVGVGIWMVIYFFENLPIC
jgi:hypothetical protein